MEDTDAGVMGIGRRGTDPLLAVPALWRWGREAAKAPFSLYRAFAS